MMQIEHLIPTISYLKSFDGEVTRKVDLTPELAQKILKEWGYKGQRKVRPSRVTTYVRQLESGDWRSRSEMNVGVLPSGKVYLLNGYHRLTALAGFPENSVYMPVRLVITLLENEEDLANYYGVIDIGGMRSPNDAIHAQGFAEEWGVAADVLRSAGSAGSLIMTDFTGGRSNSWHSAAGRSIPGRIRFLREWEPEIRSLNDLVKLAPSQIRKMVLRQPVVAIMLLTLRHVPDRADEFWAGVISGEGLYSGMPAMVLRNYLINTGMSGIAEHIYARYVANCWNGFYRKDSMVRVQVKSGGTSDLIVIDGTPYSRSRREKERLLRQEAQKSSAAVARAAKAAKKDQAMDAEQLVEPAF